ncbi:MAG: LysM domain-containing protein [Anaerolineales bacterium]|nr:MAG: LysM domain-containing protein [Anaerolineales bacterium]
MTENNSEAADVIEAYRKRKERLVPLILGGLAIVLLVVGIFFVILWFTGDSPPALPGFLASKTPTPTETHTPRPPTATPTVTLTLAPTFTPTPSGPITYIVEPGDTLSSIAEQFGVEVVLLMALNNITDPNQLFVNTEIIIPASEAQLPTKTPLPENLFPGQKIEYQIQTGDTLETIAAQFNSTAEAIAELNEIEDPNTIFVGQIILVPVDIATPTPTFTPVAGEATATTGS